eukprot:5282375-Amphidinium_carterae.2
MLMWMGSSIHFKPLTRPFVVQQALAVADNLPSLIGNSWLVTPLLWSMVKSASVTTPATKKRKAAAHAEDSSIVECPRPHADRKVEAEVLKQNTPCCQHAQNSDAPVMVEIQKWLLHGPECVVLVLKIWSPGRNCETLQQRVTREKEKCLCEDLGEVADEVKLILPLAELMKILKLNNDESMLKDYKWRMWRPNCVMCRRAHYLPNVGGGIVYQCCKGIGITAVREQSCIRELAPLLPGEPPVGVAEVGTWTLQKQLVMPMVRAGQDLMDALRESESNDDEDDDGDDDEQHGEDVIAILRLHTT